MMFQCDMCGECCRNLDKSPLYAELDRGDGTCRYLEGNLCSIYENRPVLCQVDACYDMYFRSSMTKEEFYSLNAQVCDKLKNRRI